MQVGPASRPRSGCRHQRFQRPCVAQGRSSRRRPRRMWFSLIRMPAYSASRWFAPPPVRTAYFCARRRPGTRLARVEDRAAARVRRRACHRIHVGTGLGCGGREQLQEVERRPLGRQQRAGKLPSIWQTALPAAMSLRLRPRAIQPVPSRPARPPRRRTSRARTARPLSRTSTRARTRVVGFGDEASRSSRRARCLPSARRVRCACGPRPGFRRDRRLSMGRGLRSRRDAARNPTTSLRRPDGARRNRACVRCSPAPGLRIVFVQHDLAAACLQALDHAAKAVHRHPWAVRAALARCAVAGGRRLDQRLARCELAHPVHQAVVGGDDVNACRAIDHGLQQAPSSSQRRRPVRPRSCGDSGCTSTHRVRVLAFQQFEFDALELVVHDAGAVPQQHVRAGVLLDVAAEVAVGRPEHPLALRLQVAHDGQRARTRHHPVGRAPSRRRWCWHRRPPCARGGRRRRRRTRRPGSPGRASRWRRDRASARACAGDRILADSPMKRTPATTSVRLGWSRPKRAISSESATQPPVSNARSCRSPST